MSYKILKENGKNKKIKIMRDCTINGRRYRPSKTIETKFEGLRLKALIAEIEADLQEEAQLKASDPEKLSELDIEGIREWYIKVTELEQNTIDWYRDYIGKRVISYFKNKKAVNITEADAKHFFIFLDKEMGANTKKPLSQKTKKHYLTALHSIFEKLKDEDVIEKNSFRKIKISVPRRLTKNRYYNVSEVKDHLKVLSQYATTRHFTMYVLTIMCGLRPSELRGLKWNKINWI